MTSGKMTSHDNSIPVARQPSWLHQIPVSVTVSRASWAASTNRLLALSCFSIDLFAPKPSFTVCAWVHIQPQTTYARLLKYAWADAQTHMHVCTRTCTARSSSRTSHTLEDRCFQTCRKTRRRIFILWLAKCTAFNASQKFLKFYFNCDALKTHKSAFLMTPLFFPMTVRMVMFCCKTN